jgi:uncharacterized protein
MFENHKLQKPHVLQELFLLIILFLFSMLISSLLSLYLLPLLLGYSFTYFVSWDIYSASAHDVQVFKVLQVFVSAGSFLLPAFIFPLLIQSRRKRIYTFRNLPEFKTLLVFILLLLCAYPFLEQLMDWASRLKFPEYMGSLENWIREQEEKIAGITMLFLKSSGVSDLVLNLFVIALVPAFVEEVFFRGLLQNLMIRWLKKIHVSIILTALLFSAIHLQFLGFLPRALIGMILGYAYFWSKSIWLPIIIHFLNNASAVFLVYLSENKLIEYKINENMNSPYGVTIAALAVSAALFLYLAHYYSRKRNKVKDWVKVYTTHSLAKMEILKGHLEARGIVSVLMNKRDSAITTFGQVELYVKPEDQEAAKAIILENEENE